MLGKSAVVKAGRGPEGWRGAVRQPRPLRHAAPGLLTRDVLIMQRTLAPSNVDGGVEEGAEGDAEAAFPALLCGLDLFLAGDSESENHGAR